MTLERLLSWVRLWIIVLLVGFALLITGLRFAANLATGYRDELQQTLSQSIFGGMNRPHPELLLAKLGNDAGIVGAANLARVSR